MSPTRVAPSNKLDTHPAKATASRYTSSFSWSNKTVGWVAMSFLLFLLLFLLLLFFLLLLLFLFLFRSWHHFSVCTSTLNTAGRSLTIGVHESPESAEQYTCPPVVPKYTPQIGRAS